MSPAPLRSLWFWGLAAALAGGVAFRLAWPDDIEYKADEAWTFQATRIALRDGRLPPLGMPSSQNVRNPGASVWVFVGLGWLAGAESPPDLDAGVRFANVAALFLMVWLACRVVPRPEREWWLWAAALAAVNPLAVMFQRKLWPPTAVPVVLVLMTACWFRRDRRVWALGWGALASLVGQVHMSGFVFAAAVVGWTALFARRGVAWIAGGAGVLVGSLALLPWFDYLATNPIQARPNTHRWTRAVEGKFWSHWATEPLGIGLKYSLGAGFGDFLAGPTVAGRPTYAVAALHAVVLAVAVWAVCAWAGRWRRTRPRRLLPSPGRDDTARLVNAGVWGYGLLFTGSLLPFYRHYLLVAFPLTFVWLARLAVPADGDEPARVRGRRALVILCIAQAGLTAAFLASIHANGGAPGGEFGPTYAAQVRFGSPLIARP